MAGMATTDAIGKAIDESASESCTREATRAGEECGEGIVKIGSGGRGSIVSVHDNRKDEWEFASKRLAKLSITIPHRYNWREDADTAQEIKLLTEVYGHAASTKSVILQNSFGAKWECAEVMWAMPDGGGIILAEYIRDTDSGPRRGVSVLFLSLDEMTSQKKGDKPNPYK